MEGSRRVLEQELEVFNIIFNDTILVRIWQKEGHGDVPTLLAETESGSTLLNGWRRCCGLVHGCQSVQLGQQTLSLSSMTLWLGFIVTPLQQRRPYDMLQTLCCWLVCEPTTFLCCSGSPLNVMCVPERHDLYRHDAPTEDGRTVLFAALDV